MKIARLPLYAVYIAAAANAIPGAAITRKAHGDGESDIDIDMTETKVLGKSLL